MAVGTAAAVGAPAGPALGKILTSVFCELYFELRLTRKVL